MSSLVRFRADPSAVRVAIRHVGREWYASIASRTDGTRFEARATGPRKALAKVLRAAHEASLLVDLSMSWAYQHPQR